jgi:cytochrome c oxidase cbb3-type subunit 3
MKHILKPVFVLLLAIAFLALGLGDADARRETKSKEELERAKKAGDLTREQARKVRDAYGREADEANVESFETRTAKISSGDSTYGVKGFDYLTGVGKVASDPSRINEKTFKIRSANKSPLEKLMKKRFKHKWTGQYDDTHSGWAEKSGVTEVWFRKHQVSKLGASYNNWVNQWNDLTRPDTGGITLVKGADPDQGAHWFSFYCVHCHGWTGKGDGPTAAMLDPRPRNMTNGKYLNFISNVDVFTMIKGGGKARNLSEAMPPWGNVLQDQDIWNVVAFVRSLAVNPKYTSDPDDVTAANAASSDEFQEVNEMLELPGEMAGRGANKGGYSSIGGGRLASMKTGIGGQKTSGHGGQDSSSAMGDWMEDKK